ncbi:hypothetical protein EAI_07814, partial [Harpegnathos saltator]
KLNGECWSFRIDTGSDVSIVNRKFIKVCEDGGTESCSNLVYPSREKILVRSRMFVNIELGKFSLRMPVLIMEMADDCLLGVDSLAKTNAESSIR